MSGDLSREVRKLEVRLEDFLREEESFLKELRDLIDIFREINRRLEELKRTERTEGVEELMGLRFEAIKALSETLKKEGEVEHERSHLLESYGSLLITLEEDLKRFMKTS